MDTTSRNSIQDSLKVHTVAAMWHLTKSTVGNNPLTCSSSWVIIMQTGFFVILRFLLSRPGGVRPPVCEPDGREPDWYESVWRAPVQSAVWPHWSGHGQIQQGGRLATTHYISLLRCTSGISRLFFSGEKTSSVIFNTWIWSLPY